MAARSWLVTPALAVALVAAPLAVVALVAVLVRAAVGTEPRYALAVRRDGDRLTVSAYGRCPASQHPHSLRVSTRRPDVVLWEVHGGVHDRLAARSIVVGTVPAGWVETVDNLAGHPLGPRLSLSFDAVYGWEVDIDTRTLSDGRVHRVVAHPGWWENARERHVICG